MKIMRQNMIIMMKIIMQKINKNNDDAKYDHGQIIMAGFQSKI